MPGTVVMMPNWMGDFVLALSVIERKAESEKTAPTLLAPQWLAGCANVLSSLPVIAFSRTDRTLRLQSLAEVRRRDFGTICLLPYSFSSAWFAFRSRIPVRRGIGKDARSFLLTRPLAASVRDYSKHITREYCAVLDAEYMPPESWQGKKIEPDRRFAGSIVLCPGATFGPAKKWPYFSGLVEALAGEKIVMIGIRGDADGVFGGSGVPGHVHDLTGETTIPEAAAVIAAAKCVVSNDSGLMHLAGYVGTPAVGIFGSTSPAWTRPLGSRVGIAYRREPCSPCFRRTCRYGHYNCLQKISCDSVASLLKECIS